MSDTKTILEKRIEERAESKVHNEIHKAIDSLPYWIISLRCIRNGGGDNQSIESFLKSLAQKDFKTFPFTDIEKKREEIKQGYMREETDKFLKQIDLVKQLTDEVSQYREPVRVEDIPF